MYELEELLDEHLKSKNCVNSKKWSIKPSSLGGRGLFANHNIQPGEVIFTDNPLIIGPRVAKSCPTLCVSCYRTSNLIPCYGGCGLPVCSAECGSSVNHQNECRLIKKWSNGEILKEFRIPLLKCLTPTRSLLLNTKQRRLMQFLLSHQGPQHGIEIDILKKKLNFNLSPEEEDLMRLTCAILDANSFEVITGNEDNLSGLRGLYPLSSLINHSCVPNTMHNFDCNQCMIVKATVFIPKGQEIFHSYTRIIWGTAVRQSHLASTKHFLCNCMRCKDPSEFGTNLSAIICLKCEGYVLPCINEQRLVWKCMHCDEIMPSKRAGIIISVLGSCMKEFEKSNVQEILSFLKGKLLNHVPSCNQIAMELKYKLVWILGYHQGYLLKDLSMDLLNEKQKICVELLELLKKLDAGQNKMRGLLLYELFCCLRERKKRIQQDEERCLDKEFLEDMDGLFHESRLILMDDVHAPREVKDYNKKIAEKGAVQL